MNGDTNQAWLKDLNEPQEPTPNVPLQRSPHTISAVFQNEVCQ